MSDPFFDSNILIYLVSDDPQRARRSREIVSGGGVISVQVLDEFVSVSRRKSDLDWDEIEMWLETFRSALAVEPVTLEIQARATALARRHQLHIYDATIVATAERAGCGVLYSEDLQHGATIAGVEIRNPY